MKPFLTGNQIQLLRNGSEYFPALIRAIDHASHEIYLQTYIFEPDVTGLKVGAALKNAAQRGVHVYCLCDGFGCKDLAKSYVDELKAAGVEVLFYGPKISPLTLNRGRLQRMHCKLTVIDGSVGFVGGINIIDDFDTPFTHSPRVDYAVQVQGPILAGMRSNVRFLWQKLSLKTLPTLALNLNKTAHFQAQAQNKTLAQAKLMRARFLVRDNLWHRRSIENAYLAAIKSAQVEIVIANAYFLPGLQFRHALRDAAARGVSVKLLLQARVEYMLLDLASHALYSSLLRQGIAIFEYHKGFMHSKVAVIDSQWAMVGSSNIDPFSLLMSREANIEIDDVTFAQTLRQDLQQAIESGANIVSTDDWENNHITKRFFSWLVYGLVRLMIGIAGYSNRH